MVLLTPNMFCFVCKYVALFLSVLVMFTLEKMKNTSVCFWVFLLCLHWRRWKTHLFVSECSCYVYLIVRALRYNHFNIFDQKRVQAHSIRLLIFYTKNNFLRFESGIAASYSRSKSQLYWNISMFLIIINYSNIFDTFELYLSQK